MRGCKAMQIQWTFESSVGRRGALTAPGIGQETCISTRHVIRRWRIGRYLAPTIRCQQHFTASPRKAGSELTK
jgi:hypothetical protein